MPVFIAIGMLFMLFSGLFFFAPGVIVKLSEFGNKMLFTDYSYVLHRKLSGAILFVMSLIMLYLGVTL